MVLRRLGRKSQIAPKIYRHFPDHDIYIEPFFGAGGMFFSKPKADFSLLNDIDADVFNLFTVLHEQGEAFADYFATVPISIHLWNHWRKHIPDDAIERAARFVLLSNFGYMGKMETLLFRAGNDKKITLEKLNWTREFLSDVTLKFNGMDFRDFFETLAFHKGERERTFIYADPPYLGTTNNYTQGFTPEDVRDLLNTLIETQCRFAYSEFENAEFLDIVAEFEGLSVLEIGKRRSMKNHNTEILVVNYSSPVGSPVQLGLF